MPKMMVAQIHFRHPDFADDDVVVSTGLPLSDWLRASTSSRSTRSSRTLWSRLVR